MMLKLIDLSLEKHILSMTLLVEGDTNKAYRLSVDTQTEWFDTLQSDVPEEYALYESQTKMALRRYRGKVLPESITSMWY